MYPFKPTTYFPPVLTRQERYREASVRPARLHQEDRNHGDASFPAGKGGPANSQGQDERASQAQTRQDRYRLPETARCFLQVSWLLISVLAYFTRIYLRFYQTNSDNTV